MLFTFGKCYTNLLVGKLYYYYGHDERTSYGFPYFVSLLIMFANLLGILQYFLQLSTCLCACMRLKLDKT